MTPLPLPLALADELYRHGETRTPRTVADELVRMHKEIEDLTETLAELWAASRKHAPDMAEDELAAFNRAGKLLAARNSRRRTHDNRTTEQPLALRLAKKISRTDASAWDLLAAAAALRRQHAEIEALRGVANELVVKVKELCIAYNHPLPEATLARAGEKT
jgi:hypothetical protein